MQIEKSIAVNGYGMFTALYRKKRASGVMQNSRIRIIGRINVAVYDATRCHY